MPRFNVDTKEITTSCFWNTYLFKAYFDGKQIFNQLQKDHKRNKYCFKVPEETLKEVQQTLDNCFYKPVVADSPEEYCIVVDKETNSNVILRNSVMRKQCRNHVIYLMNNKLSLKQAVEQDAIRIKVGGQGGEPRMENQRIIAGLTVKPPVRTGRYKYLPNSNLTKSVSS